MINKQVPFSLALALAYCDACLYNNRTWQQSFISKHFVSCISFCTFSLSLWATTLPESSTVINSQWDTDAENDVCMEQIEENLPFFTNPLLIQ